MRDDPVLIGRINPDGTVYEPAPQGQYRWLKEDNANEPPLFHADHIECGLAYDCEGQAFIGVGLTLKAGDRGEATIVTPIGYEEGLDLAEWILDTLTRLGSITGAHPGAKDRVEGIARRLSAASADAGFFAQRAMMLRRMKEGLIERLTADVQRAYLRAQEAAREAIEDDVRRVVEAALLADPDERAEALADVADVVERALGRRPNDAEERLRGEVARIVEAALVADATPEAADADDRQPVD